MQSSNVLLTPLLLRHALLASAVSPNPLQGLSTHLSCSQLACMGPDSFAAVLHVQSPGCLAPPGTESVLNSIETISTVFQAGVILNLCLTPN